MSGIKDNVEVNVALQYNADYNETVHYANNINTAEGGTHLSGFRSAITGVIKATGEKTVNVFKELTPTGDDFREGLAAVISVRVPDPQFEGQTKTKLGNSEVEGIVTSVVHETLSKFFEENPGVAKDCEKVLNAAEAREAAREFP